MHNIGNLTVLGKFLYYKILEVFEIYYLKYQLITIVVIVDFPLKESVCTLIVNKFVYLFLV